MKRIINNIFTKLAMVAVLVTAFAGTAWAETITITQSSLGLTGSYTSNTEKTIDGITFVYTDLMKNNDNIQAKASTGVIYNKTAFPGDISSVAITHSGTARSTTIMGSSDGTNWTQVATGSGSITADFSSKGYKYFKITRGSNAAYWTKIEVTYSTSGGGSTPSITANDVNLAYDATGGSIAYTVNNGVEGGSISAAVTDGDWITLGQGTNSSIPFSCSANSENTARTATVTFTYTYDSNKTVTKNVTVTQAAAPVIYSTIPTLFAAAASSEKSVIVTFDSWVVSGVSTNGKNIYVTDNSGNGFIIYYASDMSETYHAGDIISGTNVSCDLVLYNGAAEIKNLDASDVTITPGGTVSVSNIAMVNLAGINSGALVSYSNLTCSISNNKYYLSDGTTTLQLYNQLFAFDALSAGKVYSITGVYLQYNNTKEIMPRSAADIQEIVPIVPTITPATTSINVAAAGGDGTITVTYDNITTIAADVAFFESDGTTSATYNWITAFVNNENNVEYLVEENTSSEPRSAYMKVWAYDDNLDEVYSELITITQAKFVSAYATLPFAFDGGKSAIEGTNGLTASGLGSDYNSSPKLKFDSTGDYVILQINDRPGILSFDIQGNSFSGGTFKVQTSVDGTTYTDLETYTELGTTKSKSFDNLGENVRYIKWVYTNKSTGNVALGNMNLEAYVPIVKHTVSWTAGANTELFVFAGDQLTTINSGAEVAEGTTVWISIDVASGYIFDALTVKDANNSDVTLTEETPGSYYSFTMPTSNVTITSSAVAAPPVIGKQYKLFSGELVEGDYIIYYDGSALKNTVSNDRLSYETVTPSNDIITTSDASIVWHIAQSGSYWTIFSEDANKYAASTGAKNKAQMLADGTDDKALWTVTGTETYEFVNKANAAAEVNANLRNNSTYGFACYATSTGGALSLYKLVDAAPATIDLTATPGDGRFWATFYNADAQYILPAGAQAFTMNADHELYLVGTNGSVIPKNTAVIIIADMANFTLTQNNVGDGAIHGGDNILQGSSAPVAKSSIETGKKPYVLGIPTSNPVGFYEFTGTDIPANKAYYVE